jgi:signal peptide peptidase SppA
MPGLLLHVADRVLGRPLFLHPAKAEIILAVIGERIGVDDAELPPETLASLMMTRADKPAANRLIGEPGGPIDGRGRRQMLYMQEGGVALIPVIGTLVNRGAFVGDDGSGFMSYEGLDRQIRAAAVDPSIHSLLLDIDSPGGEANGMFGLAELIRTVREEKPVVAVVNDWAASAAYGLASAASEIVVSRTSETGSIGTVIVHVDRSKELEKRGRKVTLITRENSRKTDGNAFEPLSDAVRGDLQSVVEKYDSRFYETVSAGRMRLTPQIVESLEARIFPGEEAIGIGLADRVGSFAETLGRMQTAKGVWTMPSTNPQPAQAAATEPAPRTYSQAELDAVTAAARADRDTAAAAARQEGEAAGRLAELARVRSIMGHAEARGREGQAQTLALETTMSADEAGRLLATFPAASAPRAVPPIDQRATARPVETAANEPSTEAVIADRWARAADHANRQFGFAK